MVMKIILSEEEKIALEVLHKEASRKIADKIKSVLLRSEGWSLSKISQALRLHNDTIGRYISEYLRGNSFDFKYKGSSERLTPEQNDELISHLESNLYAKVIEIIAYVKSQYDVSYSVSGMTDWLKAHDFSYKKPKGTPSKADISKQLEFIEIYEQLKDQSENSDEPILFIDGVHPTMQTKISYGWIKKGFDKEVSTTASRTRMNVMGAINLHDMSVVTQEYKSIDGKAIIDFFDEIKAKYPSKSAIHIILDQAGYHRSFEVREYASKLGIHLHYLPPYSPNLNAIERLWKIANEEVRDNTFFKTAKEFKATLRRFYKQTLPNILPNLRSRINDNFHVKSTVN
jgi:transposase